MGMTLYNPDGTVASVFTGMKRSGSTLVIQQLALGEIPMDVILTPDEALKSMRLGLGWGVISFALGFPYFLLRHKLQKGAVGQATPEAAPGSAQDTEG